MESKEVLTEIVSYNFISLAVSKQMNIEVDLNSAISPKQNCIIFGLSVEERTLLIGPPELSIFVIMQSQILFPHVYDLAFDLGLHNSNITYKERRYSKVFR